MSANKRCRRSLISSSSWITRSSSPEEEEIRESFESICETLNSVAGCGLFDASVFSSDDAQATARLLLEAARRQPPASSCHLIPMLGKALTDAWAISRGPGLNRFPPPGVLLVAQSSAIKAISQDSWGDDDDELTSDDDITAGAQAAASALKALSMETHRGGDQQAIAGSRLQGREISSHDIVMDPSGEDHGSMDVDNVEAQGTNIINPLVGMSHQSQAEFLLDKLNEPIQQLNLFRKFATEFGDDGLWELLQEANGIILNDGPEARTLEGQPRTAGGVFIKLAAKRRSEARRNHEAKSTSPPVFALRHYQRNAVDRIWQSRTITNVDLGHTRSVNNVALPAHAAGAAMPQNMIPSSGGSGSTTSIGSPLTSHVDACRSSNWVVVAPTNAGKTAIFIEVTKLVLSQNPQAKALVLVPTIALAGQQCTAFEKAGFGKSSLLHAASDIPQTGGSLAGFESCNCHRVDWFCSDRQLRPESWRAELSRLSVLVMESGSFRNLLVKGAAQLSDIDLLVLDECHHTVKDHAYSVIMSHYKSEGKRPQVLGFSASPAGGSSVAQVRSNLESLLQRLHANLHIIHEDEVQEVAPSLTEGCPSLGPPLRLLSAIHPVSSSQVAPSPTEEVCRVQPRAEDMEVESQLRNCFISAVLTIGADLSRLANDPRCETDTRLEIICNIELLSGVSTVSNLHLDPGTYLPLFNKVCMWANAAQELAVAWKLPKLKIGLQLVEVLRRASDMVSDVGRECALQFVGRQLLSLSLRGLEAAAVGNRSSSLLNQQMGTSSDIAPGAAAAGVGAGAPTSCPMGRALPALMGRVNNGPSPSQIATASASTRQKVLWSLSPPPSDINSDPVKLCRAVLQGMPLLGGGGSGDPAAGLSLVSETVGAVVPGWLRPAPACHPKIWELVKYLEQYRNQPSFHGIIFSHTRQGAHYLAEVLRAASASPSQPTTESGQGGNSATPLGFIQGVYVFVGHGLRSGGGGEGGLNSGLAMKGMSASKQQDVLKQFKAPGRRLLVATNAAEEGMDVPCCEFVVRFSPATSGIQRVQARGRGRKLGAVYYCLVQSGTGADERMHIKSKAEEESMRKALSELDPRGS